MLRRCGPPHRASPRRCTSRPAAPQHGPGLRRLAKDRIFVVAYLLSFSSPSKKPRTERTDFAKIHRIQPKQTFILSFRHIVNFRAYFEESAPLPPPGSRFDVSPSGQQHLGHPMQPFTGSVVERHLFTLSASSLPLLQWPHAPPSAATADSPHRAPPADSPISHEPELEPPAAHKPIQRFLGRETHGAGGAGDGADRGASLSAQRHM